MYLLCILLSMSFGWQYIGYYASADWAQQSARSHFDELLQSGEKNAFTAIRITPQEKHSSDYKELNDHEFTWKGRLYDVATSKVSDDGTTSYLAYQDREEEGILRELEEHFDGLLSMHNPWQKEGMKHLLKNISRDYYPASCFTFIVPVEDVKNTLYPQLSTNMRKAVQLSLHSPPPEA